MSYVIQDVFHTLNVSITAPENHSYSPRNLRLSFSFWLFLTTGIKNIKNKPQLWDRKIIFFLEANENRLYNIRDFFFSGLMETAYYWIYTGWIWGWILQQYDTRLLLFVLTLAHRYNAVRGHKTDSNNWSGRLPQEENKQKGKDYVILRIHNNWNKSCASDKMIRWDLRTYVSR